MRLFGTFTNKHPVREVKATKNHMSFQRNNKKKKSCQKKVVISHSDNDDVAVSSHPVFHSDVTMAFTGLAPPDTWDAGGSSMTLYVCSQKYNTNEPSIIEKKSKKSYNPNLKKYLVIFRSTSFLLS